jgi:drug/metabolite transporter (DMT)-like permease
VLLKKLAHTPEASRMMAMFGGGAVMAMAVALLNLNSGLVPLPPAPALAWLVVALGLSVAFLLGNLALQYGAAHLSASATSLIMLTEVIYASASASLLGAGEITLRTAIGGALILLASLLSVIGRRA